MDAQDENWQFRPLTVDITQQLEPAYAWHREIQHNHVPLRGANFSQGFRGAFGFANLNEMKRLRQNLLDPLAHDRMVIDEKNSRRAVAHVRSIEP
jgi:hypothetical protein